MNLVLDGPRVLELKIFKDGRGSFRECFKQPLYEAEGISCSFVQDNLSISQQGVIRGLHFQKGQAKLLTVVSGKILDVFVDIRPNSPTFGQWDSVILEEDSPLQLFLPDGFAHGFAVLSTRAALYYKVSALYDPTREKTVVYNDPDIGIEWPIEAPILSDRDRMAPRLKEILGVL